MRRGCGLVAGCVVAVASAGAASAASQPPGQRLETIGRPAVVAARDGHVVFGVWSPTTHAYRLVDRYRGRARAVPVAPQRHGFDVDLGTDDRGRTVASYPRCAADDRDAKRCRLVVVVLATGHERVVPQTKGAVAGAVSGRHVAFATEPSGKAYPRLWATGLHGGPLRRLPVPAAEPDGVEIRRLDADGPNVAFVVNSADGELAESEVWLDRPGHRPRGIARIGTGGASSGFREFLAPRLSRRSIVVFQEGRDLGNAVRRFSLTGRLIRTAFIGPVDTDDQELHSATWDRGRLLFSTDPYQGSACHPFGAHAGVKRCAVLRSRRLVLRGRHA